jgi:hypothetical protein
MCKLESSGMVPLGEIAVEARHRQGWPPYKKNAFRNSYISYRLAHTKDINLVAYESGNSPEMIRKYYLDLVNPEQAAAWFAL